MKDKCYLCGIRPSKLVPMVSVPGVRRCENLRECHYRKGIQLRQTTGVITMNGRSF